MYEVLKKEKKLSFSDSGWWNSNEATYMENVTLRRGANSAILWVVSCNVNRNQGKSSCSIFAYPTSPLLSKETLTSLYTTSFQST